MGGYNTPIPHGYEVWRQSRDYLYGWNWRKTDGSRKGAGYRTKTSAINAALKHAKHGDEPYEPSMGGNLAGHQSPAAPPGMRKHPFFIAYVEAALWSSTDDSTPSGGDPLDKNYSIEDIDDSTLNEMAADCAAFIAKCNGKGLGGVIRDSAKHAGHDFWLTRNGHGAGFWDGDWGDDGDALTEIAHKFGSYDLQVDDGKVYGSGG
jgi:hypothetical protein